MCRNIRNLYNFKPPATGFNRPSKANEEAFDRAVEAVAHAARDLIDSLVTTAPPRDRDTEAEKARARAAVRFARPAGNAA